MRPCSSRISSRRNPPPNPNAASAVRTRCFQPIGNERRLIDTMLPTAVGPLRRLCMRTLIQFRLGARTPRTLLLLVAPESASAGGRPSRYVFVTQCKHRDAPDIMLKAPCGIFCRQPTAKPLRLPFKERFFDPQAATVIGHARVEVRDLIEDALALSPRGSTGSSRAAAACTKYSIKPRRLFARVSCTRADRMLRCKASLGGAPLSVNCRARARATPKHIALSLACLP